MQTHKESQGLCIPLAFVVESCEDVPGRIMSRCKIYQRNQDTEETDNVYDENDDFDSRQCTTHEHVDEYGEHQYSPQKESPMPTLPHKSRRVVEGDELQDEICHEETN